jgi:DNA-binding IclR family transcriptional regulator
MILYMPRSAGASAHMLLAFSGGKGAKTRAAQEGGYCMSLGERDPQVATVAVPVFDLSGHFRGLIGRFKEKARQAALAQLRASADRLRALLPTNE